jgi:DNA mismatch endonuclease, patch repair protein
MSYGALVSRAPAPKQLRLRQLVTGLGYQLARRDSRLPGQPAVVVALRRKLIFVHSCSDHGHIHPGCDLSRPPGSRVDAWLASRARNRERDGRTFAALRARQWGVLVIWECQLAHGASLQRRVRQFLERLEPSPPVASLARAQRHSATPRRCREC